MSVKNIRTELACYFGLSVVVYVIFYLLYPHPFVFADSNSYIVSAYRDVFNIYRPMGYSIYLSWLHSISPSLGFMTGTTYFLHIAATLSLLFSARVVLDLRRGWLFTIITICSLFAPTALFATNFVMSDSLFASLTMFFLASALWIIRERKWWIVVVHLLLFCALFEVRYSAMLYVPVSILALLFSPLATRWHFRVAMAIVPVALFLTLFTAAKTEYREQTGVDTFSAFNGWQILNNASVLIPEARTIAPEKLSSDEQVQFMHSFFTLYPDSLYTIKMAQSTALMWNNELPMKQCARFMLEQNPGMAFAIAWVNAGPMYEKYAKALILNDPLGYVTKYIFPSMKSLVAHQPITEQSNVFTAEDMHTLYYGSVGSYTHSNQEVWEWFNVARRVFNPLYWVLLFSAMVLFFWRNWRGRFGDAPTRAQLLLVLFILIYLLGSAVASPCTTWRYSLPFFAPSLLLLSLLPPRVAPATRPRLFRSSLGYNQKA